MICTLDVMQQGRLGDFLQHKRKIPFEGITQPVGSLNSPTKLEVWSFGGQSTVPSLRSSLVLFYVAEKSFRAYFFAFALLLPPTTDA